MIQHTIRFSMRWNLRPAWPVALIAVSLVTLFGYNKSALAADVISGDVFHLTNGQVVADDVYVTAQEVIIDGTIEGDLTVFAGYVEVNGVVTGDVNLFAGGIVINGAIQDDARLAGAGVTVHGSIGDDLFVAGGGSSMPMGMPFPITIGDRAIQQGVRFTGNATVGGDAYIAGGQGVLAGAVQGDLYSGMGALQFGARVIGDARLAADQLSIEPAARVDGQLRYSTSEPIVVPEGVSTSVRVDSVAQDENQDRSRNWLASVVRWLVRTALLMLGIGLVGWILISLRPRLLLAPSEEISRRTVEAGLLGIIVAALVVPVSAALVFIAVLFWGWFPGGIVTFAFLFGLFSLLWIFSPLVTGAWLGPKILSLLGRDRNTLLATLVGALVIVVVARSFIVVPCVGAIIYGLLYLLSFALTAGGLILRWRGAREDVPVA